MKWDLGKSAILMAFVTAWTAIPVAFFGGYWTARDENATVEADLSKERDAALTESQNAKSQQQQLRSDYNELLDRISTAAKIPQDPVTEPVKTASSPEPAPAEATTSVQSESPEGKRIDEPTPKSDPPNSEESAVAAATPPAEVSELVPLKEPPVVPPITKAAYKLLRNGMQYETVVAVLGREEDSTFRFPNVNGTYTDTHFWNWTDKDGAGAQLTLNFVEETLKSIDCTASWAQIAEENTTRGTESAKAREAG